MSNHMIDDKRDLYWHMLPRMLDGMGYMDHDIDRLRAEMRIDMRDKEGGYQLFTVTAGRKPL